MKVLMDVLERCDSEGDTYTGDSESSGANGGERGSHENWFLRMSHIIEACSLELDGRDDGWQTTRSKFEAQW